ncbi:MAG: hypothetical protein RIA63_15725 [Cyclobacteriaceae bacterium]
MGIKLLGFIFIISCAIKAQCQITITKFDVIVNWDNASGIVTVTEKLQLEGVVVGTELTLQSLDFKKSAIDNLNVKLGELTIPVELNKNKDGLLIDHVLIDETKSVELKYQVENQSTDIVIPLVFTPVVPRNPKEDLFSATLKIPLHYKLVESFPTIIGDGQTTDSHRTYKVELPVIPSLIKMNLADESKFILGTTEILDGFVVVTLALLSLVGWKKRKMLL